MLLPNSKAHRANAAEKPNISAITTQRKGHGKWLRTIMRGALIDIRRLNNFKRIGAWAVDDEGRL